MNATEADALLIHIARNPEISSDRPILSQLHKKYTPSFFNRSLYPANSLSGRISGLVNLFRGIKYTQTRVMKIAQQAFASSQTPLASPKIMKLGIELAKREELEPLWTNPSIAPLENHLDQLAKDAEDKISQFSLLRPEAQRRRLFDCLQLMDMMKEDREQIHKLVQSLTFDPKNLNTHIELIEYLDTLPTSPALKAIRDIALAPIYQLNDSDFESIVMGKTPNPSTREFLHQWLKLHPKCAHQEWRKLSRELIEAESRHQNIAARIETLTMTDLKTSYLYEEAAVELREEVIALKKGQSTGGPASSC